MKLLSDKIIQPLISEKSSKRETKFNEFTVVVEKKMTKTQIFVAIEKNFGVRPIAVRTVNFRKKSKRSKAGTVTQPSTFKKALIRLPEGKRIEVR